MRIILWFSICFFYLFTLSACVPVTDTNVPVIEVNTGEAIPKSGVHRVLPQETLYSIAWRYGFDYKDLARKNHIQAPFHIKQGQLIYLTRQKPTGKKTTDHPQNHPSTKTAQPAKTLSEPEPKARVSEWVWPAHGPIVQSFGTLNKGINIAGAIGDPIFATAKGKVVYSGHGLRGYGNLIIIKHNSTFLTAYAHNSKLFVHEGDWVASGQKIAEMGNTGTQKTMLHFEIRRNGKPANPLIYLDKKV